MIYILLTLGDAPNIGFPLVSVGVEVYEDKKAMEAQAHRAYRIYEYEDGKTTLLERKPIYRTVMKEVQEIESYDVSAASRG